MKGMAGYAQMSWSQFYNILIDHAQVIDSTAVKKSISNRSIIIAMSGIETKLENTIQIGSLGINGLH